LHRLPKPYFVGEEVADADVRQHAKDVRDLVSVEGARDADR
jgi:hypothetical protein